MTEMRALVTGATGLVGYNILTELLNRGRKVRALVRSLEKGKRLLPDETELVEGDVTDPKSLETAFQQVDSVFHAAGLPEQWQADDGIFQRVNVGGTANMIAAALRQKVNRFIYTSTIDVFKASRGERFNESVLDDAPKGTAYERSKQDADRLVVSAIENDRLPAVFLHPAAVYGPGPAASPGVNDLVVKLNNREVPLLLPGGMPLVFSQDVGRGHAEAEASATTGSRFILSEGYYSLTEIAQKALKLLNIGKVPPVMPLWVGRLVSAAGSAVSAITKKPPLIPKGQLHFVQWQAEPVSDHARSHLNWQPISMDQGLRETIDYLRRTGELT